jgi:hypothetical protein
MPIAKILGVLGKRKSDFGGFLGAFHVKMYTS